MWVVYEICIFAFDIIYNKNIGARPTAYPKSTSLTQNQNLLDPEFNYVKDLILNKHCDKQSQRTSASQQAILDPIIVPEDLPVPRNLGDLISTFIKLPFQYDIEITLKGYSVCIRDTLIKEKKK